LNTEDVVGFRLIGMLMKFIAVRNLRTKALHLTRQDQFIQRLYLGPTPPTSSLIPFLKSLSPEPVWHELPVKQTFPAWQSELREIRFYSLEVDDSLFLCLR
jgi:hypothetical protein